MNKVLLITFLGALACASAEEFDTSLEEYLDPRFIFINTSAIDLNAAAAALLSGIGTILVLTLFGLLIWAVVAAIASKFDDGYGYSGYSGYGGGHSGYSGSSSSYGHYQARSSDPYAGIWDNLSVLDWIAMMEEVYRKFDATSMECQQRLVCELHQNENTWGSTARKMNDAFGYLQYLELLNLPAELRSVLDTYLEAANKGRTSQKTCDEMYQGCEFSVKALINKYNGSNAI